MINLSKIKGKKGAGGLDIAIKVFSALMILGVMGFVFVIIFGNLGDTAEDAMPVRQSLTIINETLTSVDHLGEFLVHYTDLDPVCTIGIVSNASSGDTIGSGNYTQTNCHLAHPTGIGGNEGGFNNSDWHVTYTYTNRDPSARDVPLNLTDAASSFFGNAGTWLTLLSIVIIITIITLVLIRVRGGRESGMSGSSGGSRSGDDGLL